MRTIVEAIGCRCATGTLAREVHLTNDGYLMDNPQWECSSCGRTVPEDNPERVAPWPENATRR
ncbi:hypothetical protein [Streptomyces sp. 7-21]|uniref:hypothetical protein n=1 Tax=Streptomyces sp. 7-21 TaxID=2802283 RepID=UPI00191E72BA|nr:hypothetical protein [Streptomyces sp. 7-21]MBL1066933.1 hypothetical protein [Streptomyces sp. 7-21]